MTGLDGEARSMDQPQKIGSMLDGLLTLPSLPTTVVRIMQMLDDPDTSLQEVGKAVAQDPSLALKSLRLVNSAFYSLRDKVNSVERGVVLLGIKVVRNLVLTASVFETFKGGEASLLRHAVACATAGRILSKRPGAAITDPGEAFMYGLLHDVGKIIIQQNLPKEWKQIVTDVGDGRAPAHEIERRILGADHAQIGGLLGAKWKLQEDLVAAIAGHHNLALCATPQQRRRAAFVGVCDWLAYQAGFPAIPGAALSDYPAIWEESNLDPEQAAPAIEELVSSQASIEDFISLAA